MTSGTRIRRRASRPGARLFLAYALGTLLPVVVLGSVLVRNEQHAGTARALAEGRAQAAVILQMAVGPALGRRNLSAGLTTAQVNRLHDATDLAVYFGSVSQLRLRTFSGDVVFADDGTASDPLSRSDPAFRNAAAGHTNAAVIADPLHPGARTIRVLQPVIPDATGQATGVLELYVPYAPIAAVVHAEARETYVRLAVGLLLLYLVSAAISLSVTRRLSRYAARQAHQARHDSLTGLPNRESFRDHVSAVLAEAGPHTSGAIVLLDLNRFKEVNDTLGHHAGDELLRVVASRLRESVRTDDKVARLGGDEFGLYLPATTDHGRITELLEFVQSRLGADVIIEDRRLSIEGSFGVTLFPEHGADLAQLLVRADAAMYQAKRGVQRICIWSEGAGAAPTHWHELNSDLQRALEEEELVLHYQPKIELSSGRVLGVEALVRWHHPRHGLLGPADFVPAAEASTLIHPLTQWVLRRALADQRAWTRAGASWTVAVNVSALNLAAPGFARAVVDTLAEYGAEPSGLILELTETAVADDGTTEAAVAELAEAGVAVSLDDFGTGSTGLLQLRRLAVREVKIDRVFVHDLARDAGDRSLVRAIVDLAHGLGCRVVAEGVENAEVARWLRSAGCDNGQGYYFARPGPWPDLLTHTALRERPTNGEVVFSTVAPQSAPAYSEVVPK